VLTPDDLAGAYVFLASRRNARGVTGSIVTVYAGAMLRMPRRMNARAEPTANAAATTDADRLAAAASVDQSWKIAPADCSLISTCCRPRA
jgi:hypothetical protein